MIRVWLISKPSPAPELETALLIYTTIVGLYLTNTTSYTVPCRAYSVQCTVYGVYSSLSMTIRFKLLWLITSLPLTLGYRFVSRHRVGTRPRTNIGCTSHVDESCIYYRESWSWVALWLISPGTGAMSSRPMRSLLDTKDDSSVALCNTMPIPSGQHTSWRNSC